MLGVMDPGLGGRGGELTTIQDTKVEMNINWGMGELILNYVSIVG